MTMLDAPFSPLPDAQTSPEFYEDVVSKRFLAWLIDVILITLITLVASVFTLFTALIIFPLFYAAISFIYRWATLAGKSATPGMRVMAVEMRRSDGEKFDASTAFLHVSGYFVSVGVFPAQLVSIGMMLMTERRQGLTDMILGTVAINRRAL